MEIHKKIEDLNVTLLGLDTEKLGALEKIGGKLSLNCTAEYLKLPAVCSIERYRTPGYPGNRNRGIAIQRYRIGKYDGDR